MAGTWRRDRRSSAIEGAQSVLLWTMIPALLNRAQNLGTAEHCFVSARILFLTTLKPTDFMRHAVQDLELADIVAYVSFVDE